MFAYRSSVQESTCFSCSMVETLAFPHPLCWRSREVFTLWTQNWAGGRTWRLAREHIEKAQVFQKWHYDAGRTEVDLKVGERVMVYMPSEAQGQDRKLARPSHGPYRVLSLTPRCDLWTIPSKLLSSYLWTECDVATLRWKTIHGLVLGGNARRTVVLSPSSKSWGQLSSWWGEIVTIIITLLSYLWTEHAQS